MFEQLIEKLDRMNAAESQAVADDRRWPAEVRRLASARARMLGTYDGVEVDTGLCLAYTIRRGELLGEWAATPTAVERYMGGDR